MFLNHPLFVFDLLYYVWAFQRPKDQLKAKKLKNFEKNYKMNIDALKAMNESYFITFFKFLGLQLAIWPSKRPDII